MKTWGNDIKKSVIASIGKDSDEPDTGGRCLVEVKMKGKEKA